MLVQTGPHRTAPSLMCPRRSIRSPELRGPGKTGPLTNRDLFMEELTTSNVCCGSWPCQNVLPEEVGTRRVATGANFPDLDYARIAAISG